MIKIRFSYKEVVLSIMAATLIFMAIEVCRMHDSIRYDYRPEKNIHFNRWYDVSMFKGTQLNIDETSESNPFEEYKEKENETENSEKSVVKK